MTEFFPEIIDPAIFEESRRPEFDETLKSQARLLSESMTLIEGFNQQSDSSSKVIVGGNEDIGTFFTGGQVTEIGGSGESHEISLEDTIKALTGVTIVSEDKYFEACANQDTSAQALINYIASYQEFLDKKLTSFYPDAADRLVESWRVAWKQLQTSLRDMGGTTLIDTADCFDGLIEFKHPVLFDPSDGHRGPSVRLDVSTYMFYDVLMSHLTRAPKRQGET